MHLSARSCTSGSDGSSRVKKASIVTVAVFVSYLVGLALLDVSTASPEISIAERRPLAKPPSVTFRAVMDGDLSDEYAAYLQDQVVFRDRFRAIPAEYVKGRPLIIYYSYDRNRMSFMPQLTEIRWDRLLSPIR